MSEEKNLQSFVMYASFLDAAMGLNDEDFREYVLSLKDYALYGIEHESKNPMVNGLITMAQPNLEAAWERRKKAVKNGEYGILGGRPRKGETAEEYKARKAKTLNNPMGFRSETLNGNVDVKKNEKENKKVNVKRTWNEDVDEDEKDNLNGDNGISRNTNENVENDSIRTNAIYSSLNLEEEETDQREEPRREIPRQEVVSPYSKGQNEGGGNQDEEDDDDNNQSSPPIRTDGSPKNHQSLIDEVPNTPPAPPKKSKREELTEFMETSLELAAEEKEKSGELADFMPYLYQAKEAYKELHNCDEERAREEVTWELHCLMENRKQKAELAAMLSKSHKDETPDLVSPK